MAIPTTDSSGRISLGVSRKPMYEVQVHTTTGAQAADADIKDTVPNTKQKIQLQLAEKQQTETGPK